ncbi:hypothetical protein KP509_29G082400 [Ceratopteris richardii]|nr:hypothetical protein KP509_29G082400 [Ceratopteris richardii]
MEADAEGNHENSMETCAEGIQESIVEADAERNRENLTEPDGERSRSRSPEPPPVRGRSRSPVRRRTRSPSRSRSRSRSGGPRSSSRREFTLPVCRDFIRGRCLRAPIDCRYAHPPPTVGIDGNEVIVCHDSLRDRCARGYSCRFFHPPPHLRVKVQELAGIHGARNSSYYHDMPYDGHRSAHMLPPPPPLPPPSVSAHGRETPKPTLEVCRDFVRGRCARHAEECRYAHHTSGNGNTDYVIVCQDFLRGKCHRSSCRYFHPPNHLRPQIRDRILEPYARDAVRDRHGGGYRPYIYNGGYYEHSHYQGATLQPPTPLPPPPPMMLPPHSKAPRDEDKLPICRDFHLRGNCSRESLCRFVHPDSNVQVVDNYVTVCRDYVRGHCKREQCRFYHPSDKHGTHSKNGDERRFDNGERNNDNMEAAEVASAE